MDLYGDAVLKLAQTEFDVADDDDVLSTLINRQIIMGHLHGRTAKHSWRVKRGKVFEGGGGGVIHSESQNETVTTSAPETSGKLVCFGTCRRNCGL